MERSLRWTEGFSDSASTTTTAMAEIENMNNVDTAGDSKLGSPNLGNCVAAAAQFGETTSAVELNPQDGSLIKISGKSPPYCTKPPILPYVYIPRLPLPPLRNTYPG